MPISVSQFSPPIWCFYKSIHDFSDIPRSIDFPNHISGQLRIQPTDPIAQKGEIPRRELLPPHEFQQLLIYKRPQRLHDVINKTMLATVSASFNPSTSFASRLLKNVFGREKTQH